MSERLPKTIETITAYAAGLERNGRLTPIVQEAVSKACDWREDYRQIWYIAGALTGVSVEYKQRYEAMDMMINSRFMRKPYKMHAYVPHIGGTDPIKHPNVTPAEVRDIDYLWAVETADGHFNFWQPTAHGNAIENGWAEANGIPSVSLTERHAKLSRLVLGMSNIAHTIEYDDFMTDGLEQVATYLEQIDAPERTQPLPRE